MTVEGNFANCLSSCCACLHNLHNDLLSSRLWNPQFGSSFPSNPPTTNANLLFAWQNLQLKKRISKRVGWFKTQPIHKHGFSRLPLSPWCFAPLFLQKKTPTNQRWCHFPLQKGTCRAVSFRTSGTTERKFCCCSTWWRDMDVFDRFLQNGAPFLKQRHGVD